MKSLAGFALLLLAALFFSPHFTNAQETCVDCHMAEENPDLRDPVKEILQGRHINLSCVDCHFIDIIIKEENSYLSDHQGVPREFSSDQNIEVCARRCHENTLPYRHGEAVSVESIRDPVEELPVVCTSCHEAHATLASMDRGSWIYRVNIPVTCGGRNQGICHASKEVADKYGILDAYPAYLESGHGRMQALGLAGAAVCVDCHGPENTTHTSIVEKRNPDSPIHPRNREKTCTQSGCHEAEGVKVSPGSMHGRSELSILGTPVETLIDAFYSFVIVLFVGGAGLFIILDISRRFGGER
jgi:hypothetical protein